MNTMNHFRMSDLTTPQELMDADLNDRDKLFLGLESRTLCCFSVVPTDCMNGICGHGTHENRETLDDEDYVDDGPCTEYQDSDILYHPICPNVRSHHMARWESREAWEETHCSWTA